MKLFLVGRGKEYIALAQYDSQLDNWDELKKYSCFRDSDGWDSPPYYSTIQAIAFNDSLLYIAGRGRNGVGLALRK